MLSRLKPRRGKTPLQSLQKLQSALLHSPDFQAEYAIQRTGDVLHQPWVALGIGYVGEAAG